MMLLSSASESPGRGPGPRLRTGKVTTSSTWAVTERALMPWIMPIDGDTHRCCTKLFRPWPLPLAALAALAVPRRWHHRGSD